MSLITPVRALDLEQLTELLTAAWSAETSSSDAWDQSTPSRGQCAVTALVVQDVFGGDLLRGEVDGGSHYWNRLPGGQEVDLTKDQFGQQPTLRGVSIVSRGYVLRSPDTMRRYHLLREAISAHTR